MVEWVGNGWRGGPIVLGLRHRAGSGDVAGKYHHAVRGFRGTVRGAGRMGTRDTTCESGYETPYVNPDPALGDALQATHRAPLRPTRK